MDLATLAAYQAGATKFAALWHAQPAPDDLHTAVTRFFQPGRTADIGCGSGREVGWLWRRGFPAVGYDPSQCLLDEARARYPDLTFASSALPDLAEVPAGHWDNVLCETVIMHLARNQIGPAVARLMAILRPGGTLYLSWRVTHGADQRDAHGRLYTAFDKELVVAALGDAPILLDEETVSASSGKAIHRIVARRKPA
jgi:SAM-dependent methyltransferase